MTFEEASIVAFDRLIGRSGDTAAVIRWRWMQSERSLVARMTEQLWPSRSPVSVSLVSENWPQEPEHLDERGSEPA